MEQVERPKPKIAVESVSQNDIKEALMGSVGNPSYQEQFGITSAELGTTGAPPQPTLAELELEADRAYHRALNPAGYVDMAQPQAQPNHDVAAELAKFQKLYGDSENEKGSLRKTNAELTEAFNGLMAQFEAIQASQRQPQPGWGPQPAPSYPPRYGMPPNDPFEGIGDDDVIQGKQVKGLIERTIAPALGAAFEQAQAAQERAAALERQMLAQAKASAGITPIDEYRILSKNPWLRSIPEAQRYQAIASLKQSEQLQTPQQTPFTQPPANTTAESQTRILNRTTYIEGAPPQVEDTSAAALEAARQRDFAKAMALPDFDGSRARALRALSDKYGLGWGKGTDLAR